MRNDEWSDKYLKTKQMVRHVTREKDVGIGNEDKTNDGCVF